jgi:hypothetical protein
MGQYSIYGNFNNDGFSSTSYSLSATSISANTFFGDIGASFIGSGNPANFVTNQEFSYMSATTGNVQTQINTKTSNLENYLIYSGDNSVLTNSYKIVPSLNLTSYTDNNFFYLDAKVNALSWNTIYHQTSGGTNGVLTNYSPPGWNGTYPNLATEILIDPLSVINIQTLSGNAAGRICKLTNVGKYPIIISNSFGINEQTSAVGTPQTIVFSRTISDFVLKPSCSVSFIHSGTYWYCMDKSSTNGWDYIDRFTNVWRDVQTTNFNSTSSNSRNPMSLPRPTKYFTISAHTDNLPNIRNATRNLIYGFQYGLNLSFFVNNFDLVPQTKFISVGQYNRNNILTEPNKMIMFDSVYSVGSSIPGNPITMFGFQNSNNSFGYSAATNSFTSFVNFNGGIFFLNDSGFSSSMIYCVQTNDGSSITGVTNLVTNGVSFAANLGMCVLTPSGSSSGETIFYTKNNTTNVYTIYPKVIHTGSTIVAYPSIYMYVNRNVTATYSSSGPIAGLSIVNMKMIEHYY